MVKQHCFPFISVPFHIHHFHQLLAMWVLSILLPFNLGLMCAGPIISTTSAVVSPSEFCIVSKLSPTPLLPLPPPLPPETPLPFPEPFPLLPFPLLFPLDLPYYHSFWNPPFRLHVLYEDTHQLPLRYPDLELVCTCYLGNSNSVLLLTLLHCSDYFSSLLFRNPFFSIFESSDVDPTNNALLVTLFVFGLSSFTSLIFFCRSINLSVVSATDFIS